MRVHRAVGPFLVAVLLSGCAVAVRGDRATIGGGPEQATAQALVIARSTAVAFATVQATSVVDALPCECEAGK